MNDGFVEQDARGVITGWNADAERLSGWSAAEAIGMPAARLVPERHRARHAHSLETLLRAHDRHRARQEITALDRDGREFRAMLDRSIVERDGARFIATRIREATPDVCAESAFGPGGVRYRAIVDQLQDGCCVVDLRGNDLFDALQREAFDLVLMDEQMPEMDGFEATAAIRQMERDTGRHVRIVAMTAHAMSRGCEHCLAAGIDRYLSRPIDQRTPHDVVLEQ